MDDVFKLPPLSYKGNEQKKLTLHLFLQIIGKIRMDKTERKNHWWYITEYISTKGFSTGPIPYKAGTETFQITINVRKHLLEVENSLGGYGSFELVPDLSVAEFYKKLSDILQSQNIAYAILDKPFELNIEKKFSEISDVHHYDKNYVTTLWKTMIWIDGVFKEFSGRFYGKTCPVQLYWHSMDLTVTRFSGRKAPPMPKEARLSDKDAYSHEVISFGFWPGDANVTEPAFYSYTYPSPKDLEKENLKPDTAAWVDNNNSPMALLKYADLIKEKNPRKVLLDFMESAYQAGAKLAMWDVEGFTVPDLEEL